MVYSLYSYKRLFKEYNDIYQYNNPPNNYLYNNLPNNYLYNYPLNNPLYDYNENTSSSITTESILEDLIRQLIEEVLSRERIRERSKVIHKELVATVWHPKRVEKWIEHYGQDFEQFV